MKKGLLIAGLLFTAAVANSQATFQKAISIPFMSVSSKNVAQTSDGGYLIGAAGTNGGCVLIKTNDQGTIGWTKTYSFADGAMQLVSSGECIGGGYYIFGTGNDSAFTSTAFSLTKTDLAGNVVWNKQFPFSTYSYGYPKCRCTADGGFLISQSFYSSMGALKLDANGNIQWNTSYSDDPNDQSPKCPSFNCLINSDGSMVFEGKRNSDVLLVKTNPNGTMAWSSTIGNGSSYYHAYGLTKTMDGGYAVCGYANYSPFVMKVSSTGAIMWYHEIVAPGGGELDDIYETSGGDLLSVGTDYSNNFFIRFDFSGNLVSSTAIAATSMSMYNGPTFCPTSDGGFSFVVDYSDQTSGMTALSFMKTDASGNFPCGFSNFPVTYSTTQINPTCLTVPIYAHTLTATQTSPACSAVTLNATETDFCTLFSTNDHIAEAGSISIFPSPITAGENIHIAVNGAIAAAVEIYNVDGKLVRSMENANANADLEIATTDLAPGIYLARVTDADHNLLGTSKFIVR
jgi:hypothetical protein